MIQTAIALKPAAPAGAGITVLPAPRPMTVIENYVTRPWADNRLAKRLAKVVFLCKTHQENSLPQGHKYYVKLVEDADGIITDYCKRWDVSRDDVEMRYPALAIARSLAVKCPEPPQRGILPLIILGGFGFVALPFVFGLWSGLFGTGVTLVHHLFGG